VWPVPAQAVAIPSSLDGLTAKLSEAALLEQNNHNQECLDQQIACTQCKETGPCLTFLLVITVTAPLGL
jgi:hypothetical protein